MSLSSTIQACTVYTIVMYVKSSILYDYTYLIKSFSTLFEVLRSFGTRGLSGVSVNIANSSLIACTSLNTLGSIVLLLFLMRSSRLLDRLFSDNNSSLLHWVTLMLSSHQLSCKHVLEANPTNLQVYTYSTIVKQI